MDMDKLVQKSLVSLSKISVFVILGGTYKS